MVAWDIIGDAFEGALSQFNPAVRGIFKLLTASGASGVENLLVRTAMRSSLVRQWGIKQGMHVFGVDSPYEMFRATARYQTRDLSPLIRQDVLLLAGAEDHYVPVRLFYDQIKSLTHARSVTARLFTRDEQAQNHCQVGNIGLVIEVILNWVEDLQR